MPTATLGTDANVTPAKTQVYYTRCPAVPTNSSLAYQLGYLDEELAEVNDAEVVQEIVGLDPKIKPDVGDPFSFRHAGHIKAAWARAEGADSRLVSLSWLEGSYPIYTLDLSIHLVGDLKGKRLAVFHFKDNESIDLLRAQQLRIYESTLGTAGLSLSDVKLVDIVVDKSFLPKKTGLSKPGGVFAALNRKLIFALVRGEVDVITAQLEPETANLLGFSIVHDTRRNEDKISRANPSVLRGVVVSAGLLRENRDLVVRILARHLEAAAWAVAHPDKTVDLISKDLSVPQNVLRSRYEDLAEGLQVGLEADKVEALRDLKDFYLRHELISRDFDLDAWIDPTPLADARELLKHRQEKK